MMGELTHAMEVIDVALREAATKGERAALQAARDVIGKYDLPAITSGSDAVGVHDLRRRELALIDEALAGRVPPGVAPLDYAYQALAKWAKEMVLRS